MAERGILLLSLRISSAKSIRRSTIPGLASASSVFLEDTGVGVSRAFPERMRLRDALSDAIELTIQVTSISRMVPLSTSSLSRREPSASTIP